MTAFDAHPHLPDPETQPEFYESVVTKRLLAWVLDISMIACIIVPIFFFTLGLAFLIAAPLWLVISFLYRWATLSNRSATLGMRVMSIELRSARGQRLDGGTAFIHTLGYFLSSGMFLVQLVSIACMLASRRGQSLTDLALGTVMLNQRA
jgi:uncharacterized RDD family membrane protein YckC